MTEKKIYVIHDWNSGETAVFDTKEKLKNFIAFKKKELWDFDELEFLEDEDYNTHECIINKGY